VNPKEELEALLAEAGKALSTANETKVKAAITALKGALDALTAVVPVVEESAIEGDPASIVETIDMEEVEPLMVAEP
jgi:hypothetical protein